MPGSCGYVTKKTVYLVAVFGIGAGAGARRVLEPPGSGQQTTIETKRIMTPQEPKIHIERMMHRNSIAVTGESAASYALVKLIPAGWAAASSPWA